MEEELYVYLGGEGLKRWGSRTKRKVGEESYNQGKDCGRKDVHLYNLKKGLGKKRGTYNQGEGLGRKDVYLGGRIVEKASQDQDYQEEGWKSGWEVVMSYFWI